jgi:hypothetical protein
LLFDSQNNQWIFVHENVGGATTSSVLIMGPQTFNNIGNETTLITNRITKGAGGDLGEHITSSNITDTGTVVSINSATEITGSLRGQLSALSISGNTASVNLSTNNFFTLTLANGTGTNINPTNINPGQTVNILVTQGSLGTGTVTFPSLVKQPSGHLNFSVLDNIVVNSTNNSLVVNKPVILKTIVKEYQIIRMMSGLASLVWTD